MAKTFLCALDQVKTEGFSCPRQGHLVILLHVKCSLWELRNESWQVLLKLHLEEYCVCNSNPWVQCIILWWEKYVSLKPCQGHLVVLLRIKCRLWKSRNRLWQVFVIQCALWGKHVSNINSLQNIRCHFPQHMYSRWKQYIKICKISATFTYAIF